MWKKKVAGIVAAGLAASLYLGVVSQQAAAAPVIANMPHKADGTRISGNQSIPKTMPKDVVTKTRIPQEAVPKTELPKTAGTAAMPKPATPAVQTAPKPVIPAVQTTPKVAVPAVQTAPKPVTPTVQTVPKPAVPAVVPKPATPAVQTAPKPVTPAVQTAPKQITPAVQTVPKAVTPAVRTVPKPAVQVDPGGPLPTKPPAWQRPKPSVKTVPEKPKRTDNRSQKKEKVKSVYQVGDKGWKIKQAQQYLLKLGFEPGETDGRFTKSTRKAIRKFQKSSKLKETGNLDNATYEELKWRAEAKFRGGDVASAKILKTAAQYRGVRYVFGGTTPSGFDCSGYVQFVFAKHGIRLTRTADTQAREGKFVSRKALRPGDLVFFTTYEPGASHVGIYAGNNKFWNATSSRGIMLSDLTDSYWGPRYYTARRILAEK